MMENWQLLSASKLNVAIHQQKSLTPIQQSNPHRGIVNSAVYNHTNKVIATCGQDSQIYLRSPTDFEKDKNLLNLTFHTPSEEPTSINCLQFSNKSKYIAAGGANGLVKVWDMKSSKDAPQKLRGHTSAITSLVWIQNQTAIASSSIGGDIFIHKVSTGRLQSLASRKQDGYNCIKVSQSQGSCQLVACTTSGSILLWDLNATTKRPSYIHQDPQKSQITCLSISKFRPSFLAATSLNSSFSFYDTHQKKSIKTISAQQPLTAVAFHQNGHTISIGGINGGLWVHDLRRSNQNIAKLIGHDTSIKNVCFPTIIQRDRQRESRVTNTQTNYTQSRTRQTRQQPQINRSNPNSQTTIQQHPKTKNLTSNPSTSKLTSHIRQPATQPPSHQTRQDKSSNSRIVRSKKQQPLITKPLQKQQPISKSQIEPIVYKKYAASTIDPAPSISATYSNNQIIHNKDLKILQDRLKTQQNQLRQQLHDRFDTLHLQIIRQMQLGMKTMLSKMQEINMENLQLKNKLKNLQMENQNLKKRTY